MLHGPGRRASASHLALVVLLSSPPVCAAFAAPCDSGSVTRGTPAGLPGAAASAAAVAPEQPRVRSAPAAAAGEPAGPRPSLARGLRVLAEDAGAVFSAPARWRRRGWAAFSGVVATTAALVAEDEEIRREVRASDAPDREETAERIEWLGRPEVGAALPWVSYAVASMARSPTFKKTSLVAFEAWVLTAAATATLKGITARAGPADGEENDFWKGSDFFPSGHTSRTFAIAAVFAERHGARAAWIAYPLAALVGLARIETTAHWASDVAAGAALGIAVGRAVARRHPVRPEPGGPEVGSAPPDGAGAAARGAPWSARAWSLRPVARGLILEIRF